MIKDLIEVFTSRLEMSEDEAIVAACFCLGGFTIDALFFPGGLLPGVVTTLSGASGYFGAKLFKKTPYYRRFVLKQIDYLVKNGHLSSEEGMKKKEAIISTWYPDKE